MNTVRICKHICWFSANFFSVNLRFLQVARLSKIEIFFMLCKAVIISFLVSPTNFKIFRIGGGKKIKIKIGNPLNINLAENFQGRRKKVCVMLNTLSNVIGISMSSSMGAEFILPVAPPLFSKFAFPSETLTK